MHVFDRRSHIFRIQPASEDNRNFGVAHDNLPADRPIVCLSGASNLISCDVDAVENETVHQFLEGFGIGDAVGRNDIDGFEYLQVGKPAPQTFHRTGSNFAVKLDGSDFALLQHPLKFIYLFYMGYQHCFHRRRQRPSNVPRNSSRNKVRAIMSLADQEADSISTELSSHQGILLSSYSTNFDVHCSLAFRSSASIRDTCNSELPGSRFRT